MEEKKEEFSYSRDCRSKFITVFAVITLVTVYALSFQNLACVRSTPWVLLAGANLRANWQLSHS